MERSNKKSKDKEPSRDFKYEIVRHIGILGESETGWKKELNIVRWNDANPKIDIREWDPEHEKMSRGTTLNPSEGLELKKLLEGVDFSKIY